MKTTDRIAQAAYALTGPKFKPDRVRISPKTHYDIRVEEAEWAVYHPTPEGYVLHGLPVVVDPHMPDGIARIEVDVA